ncbi:MAG: glycosyltransferase family 39 protein [Nanoarchaeota archaeon]|nr:glycosyltransferase family 39 protein [Nanoarchaeota archaeon]
MKTKIKNREGFERITICTFVVIAIAVLLRFLLAFITMPAGDGCWHLNVARFIANNAKFPLFETLGREVFARPPLYHIIASAFYMIFESFGAGGMAFRIVNPLFGSLTVLFTYFLLNEFFDNKKMIFWSVFFVSFLPLHLYFSSIPHIDILVSFLTILTIFFLIKKMYFLTGVSFGLAMLSKYSGPFIFFIICFYLYQNFKSKQFMKKIAIISIPAFLIAFPWYIRNWILLGNPVWPMLGFIFGGYRESMFSSFGFSIVPLFNVNWLISLYLGLFGVPQGNISALNLIPMRSLFLPIWVLSTLIFIFPLILFFAVRKKPQKLKLFYLWVITFIFVSLSFLLLSRLYPRILLPAVPAIGLLWAIGLSKIPTKYSKYANIILIIIAIGFAGSEFFKTNYASNQWKYYDEDFMWVRANTEKDAIFFANGQCFSYYLERQVISSYFFDEGSLIDIALLRFKNVDYIWLNQNFGPDPHARLNEDILGKLDLNEPIYYNEVTGTEIYRVE